MAVDKYRIFGSELSPYSIKVRSYFRYKGIPHQWILRDSTNQEEFQRHAKLPLVPLVVAPDGRSFQDSTPIIEHFEKLFPEPAIHPSDPGLAFVSALIEEYGDEWGNKPMFHYRWTYDADQRSAAERLARGMMPGLDADALAGASEAIRSRMVSRLFFVGSDETTRDQIEGSFRRLLGILESHLATRPYLLGARPSFGDFGLFAQLHQCATDPTPGEILRTSAPRTVVWIERMLSPQAPGDFEEWPALAPTLAPLLREIASTFLLERRERARDRGGLAGPGGSDRRQAVPAAGAEVPCQVARGAARALRGIGGRGARCPDDHRVGLRALARLKIPAQVPAAKFRGASQPPGKPAKSTRER